jgi:hypothetical protein
MKTLDIEQRKQKYILLVYEEMKKRGFSSSEIPVVIGKTGFMDALNEYPEEQLHYSASAAVDEILLTAANN